MEVRGKAEVSLFDTAGSYPVCRLVGPVLQSVAARGQADTQAEHIAMSAEQGILKKVRGCEPIALPKEGVAQPKYVKAIESSTLARWCLAHGETITIPKLSEVWQRPLLRAIDQISAAKATDPAADTGKLEEQIDWLVYDLYGLTNEETAAVADFFWDGTLTEEEEDQALLRAMEEADINDRLGITVDGETAVLRRFLPRGEIYRHFP